jgi:prepilin-type N-terminal cleavage/methylation domain-containing protein
MEKMNKKKMNVSFSKGFTLVELLVVMAIIGLLSAGAILYVTNIINNNRFDATVSQIEKLKNAIIGDPTLITNNIRTDFGYVGDMGRLPANFNELIAQGVQPAWNPATQCGWHGPYIRSNFQEDANAYQRDGWANNFNYNNTTGVITSLGSDGVAGGADFAADVNSEVLNTLITNSIIVKVFDGRGNPATNATITVFFPSNGTQTSNQWTLLTSDAGVRRFDTIPIGLRRITVSYNGETYTKWVAVVPSTTIIAEFKVIKSPTTPNAPTALTATPYSTTKIKLNWTAPALNTDGSSLVDLVSYNIYKSTTSGAETFYLNTGNTNTNYTDTMLSEAQTYYYKVASLNSGSNISAQSAEASANASIIQLRGAATIPAIGNSNQNWRIPIQNLGPNTITISSIQLTWTRGAIQRDLGTIAIGPNLAWTTVWTGGAVDTPTALLNFSPTYDLTTAMNDREIRLTFIGGAITLDSLTIRINKTDGYIILE